MAKYLATGAEVIVELYDDDTGTRDSLKPDHRQSTRRQGDKTRQRLARK